MQINYSQKGHYMYPDDTFAIAFEIENTIELFIALKELFRQCPVWDVNLLTHDKFPPEIDKELALELYSKWVTRVKRTLHYLRLGKSFKPLVLNVNYTCDEDIKYSDMILEVDRFIYYNGSYVVDPFVNKVKLMATDISTDPFIVFTHKQLTSALLDTKGKLEKVLPNYFNLKPKEYLCYLIKDDKLILRKRIGWK